MKTIVVPTDFSELSKNAVMYAVDFAASIKASVSLLHICGFPTGPIEIPFSETALTMMHEEAEELMGKFKEDIKTYAYGRTAISSTVRHGYFIEELQEYCDAITPYAVIMSSHSTTGLQRFLLGSNTASSLKRLSWPLIVVPAGSHYSQIKKIALACDLKEVASTIPVSTIADMIQDFKAQLYVIHVNSGGESEYENKLMEESFDLQHLLQPFHPSYHFLDEVEVEDGLIAFSEKFNIDLLIMLPKRHDLIEKIFRPAHSKDIALHAPLPVMSIHQA